MALPRPFLRGRGLLLAVLAVLAGGAVAATNRYATERRVPVEADVPRAAVGRARSYLREGRVAPGDVMDLHIVLKHDPAAVEALRETLAAVSDPRDTARYGQHLSIDEVTALVGPAPSHAEAVQMMLRAYGVPAASVHVNRNRDLVTVRDVAAPLVEDMLQTKLFRFHHKAQPDVLLVRAAEPYSLPASIAPYVSFVGELLRFPTIRSPPFVGPRARPFNGTSKADDAFNACGDGCAGFVTPEVLAQRYRVPASLGDAPLAVGNSMAVAEFQGQYWDRRDLYHFSQACAVDSVSVDKTYARNIPFVCTRAGGCVESLLDIQWIATAGAQGAIPLAVYYSASYSILDWIAAVNDNEAAELVHSVSYGNDEAQQTGADYMESVNIEFMKAGARGLSIFIASGDQGVYGREGPEDTVFHPDFPASSPYCTAVGGTNFVTQSVIGEEEAWNGSGGGFSDTFPIPSYQTEAVANYKMVAAASLPPRGMWNNTGRGYPDLSALGGDTNPYCVAAEGRALGGVWGTSASTPVVAGIFAQLNNLRINAGKPPLGFVNPFIYQNADAFFDVTKGVNDGGLEGGNYGFRCAPGWDPATGLGTPNYEVLKTRV